MRDADSALQSSAKVTKKSKSMQGSLCSVAAARGLCSGSSYVKEVDTAKSPDDIPSLAQTTTNRPATNSLYLSFHHRRLLLIKN